MTTVKYRHHCVLRMITHKAMSRVPAPCITQLEYSHNTHLYGQERIMTIKGEGERRRACDSHMPAWCRHNFWNVLKINQRRAVLVFRRRDYIILLCHVAPRDSRSRAAAETRHLPGTRRSSLSLWRWRQLQHWQLFELIYRSPTTKISSTLVVI